MAAAVLDIRIDPLPKEITGLDRYEKAYVVFRYGEVPVTSMWIPVEKGRIDLESRIDLIFRQCEGALVDEWVRKWKDAHLPAKPVSITIAICTRDRTDDLRCCLDSLIALPNQGQEILVIDNAPSDQLTRNLVQMYKGVRYCLEKRVGLNVARNLALQEAKGEIVAFIDDDAVADHHWLSALTAPFIRDKVACVTGMTQPLELAFEGQEAFERYSPFAKGFRRRLFDTSVNPLNTGQVGAGVNMAIRRSVVDSIGWFDERLDAGTPTQSGGDHEYFTRILRSGYYIVYEPRALNWHRHRRTIDDAARAIYGYGVGMYAYWTKLLLEDKEWWIIRLAANWFYTHQLRHLLKAIFRKGEHYPLALIWAEWKGCFKGPSAYFQSKKQRSHYHGNTTKIIRRRSYA